MSTSPKAPAIHDDFVARYPQLGKAWDLIHEAGAEGPLDEKTQRLIKLGIAIGAMREGAIGSSVRKARALGITPAEIEQVIALAAGTLGMPSTVAVFAWIRERLARG
jgi:alkylhydroperoxidase/carboxymuconolactone decarboxylase family protein YurZ